MSQIRAMFARKKPGKPATSSKSPPPAPGRGAALPNDPAAGVRGRHVDFTVGEEGLLKALRAQVSNPGGSSLDSVSGAGRAARLLLALGPEQAAHILKELAPAEIERLMMEMARIDHITAAEKKDILEHFDEVARDFEAPVHGGMDQARKILELSHGEAAAAEIIGRLSRNDLYRDFEFLEKIDAPVLAASLSQEHTQVAAVALSFLKPKIAATVLRHLPAEFRAEVALRIARTSKIHPEAVQRVARVLREKFEKRTTEVFSEIGGASTLANILNHLDRTDEDSILNVLGTQAPDILDDVRERLYTFEELIHLDSREMRLLIAKVGDDSLLSTALRGAGEEIRRHFFNCISQNRAADILEEMDRRGPLSIKEINEARSFVLNVARRLDEEGSIVIKKEKEDYI